MGYKQSKERRRRLKKLYDDTKNSCRGGAWYDDEKERYIRYPSSNTPGYAKSLRRITNKKIRKSKDLLNHGLYKKIHDYWWSLF